MCSVLEWKGIALLEGGVDGKMKKVQTSSITLMDVLCLSSIPNQCIVA